MQGVNVIFTLEGVELTIQCTQNDVMKDICQRYANKITKNINTLVFLYGGSQLNFNLKFKDIITDKERKEMKILVYSNETDEFICPKCGEKIKLNIEKIDDIISSINNLKETIDSAKFMIENVIKISTVNNVNIQLRGVNIILNSINEDIKKTKEKVKNLLGGDNNIANNNSNNNNNPPQTPPINFSQMAGLLGNMLGMRGLFGNPNNQKNNTGNAGTGGENGNNENFSNIGINDNNDSNVDYKEKYKNQLAELKEFGFVNEEKNIQVLKKCNGNVQFAIEILLNMLG